MRELTMSKEVMEAMDTIGKMVYNADLWGMHFLTIKRPSNEIVAVIKSLPKYEITESEDVILITW